MRRGNLSFFCCLFQHPLTPLLATWAHPSVLSSSLIQSQVAFKAQWRTPGFKVSVFPSRCY